MLRVSVSRELKKKTANVHCVNALSQTRSKTRKSIVDCIMWQSCPCPQVCSSTWQYSDDSYNTS